MWADLMVAQVPLLEKVARSVAVYVVILVLLRLAGKRDLAQFNTFDLVVMLLLSNVVQNAIMGPDYSVTGAALGAAVLLGVNSLVERVAARWTWVDRLLEGGPTVLARDGQFDRRTIKRLGLRPANLASAVRHQGGHDLADTARVTLEPGGTLLVRLRPDQRAATVHDVAELRAQLDRIERLLATATGTAGSGGTDTTGRTGDPGGGAGAGDRG